MSLWTLDTEGTTLSELEWHLRAGPAWTAKQAQDDVELMTELPCYQRLHGHKPHAPNSHRMCPADPAPLQLPPLVWSRRSTRRDRWT